MTNYIYALISAMLYGLLVFGGKVMGIAGFSMVEVLIIPNLIVAVALSLITYKNRAQLAGLKPSFFLLWLAIIVLG